MYDNVFINYASEDIKYAEGLFDVLSLNGFDPWMDKKKILPGQDWGFYIETALQKADFIILLLSSVSVAKRGYVQKEVKKALDFWENKLKSDIYLIPIKIDSCEIPLELRKFQWVQYIDNNSFKQIINALEAQKQVYLKEDKHLGNTLSLSYDEVHLKKEIGNRPGFIYDIKYPRFRRNPLESVDELNKIIEGPIAELIVNTRSAYLEHKQYVDKTGLANKKLGEGEGMELGNTTIDYTYDMKLISKRLISFTLFRSWYVSGGAHGMYETLGHNFYFDPVLKKVKLCPFYGSIELKKALEDKYYSKLLEIINAESPGHERESGEYGLKEQMKKDYGRVLTNFYLTKDSVVFILNPYQLFLGFSNHLVEIPFDELPEKIKTSETFIEINNAIKEE